MPTDKFGRRLRVWAVILLLASLTLQADPIITDDYEEATAYTNGVPRDSDDVFTEAFMCGPNQGGPYLVEITVTTPGAPPSTEDYGPCVTGPGTYYYRGITHSIKYGTASDLSVGERNFTVTAQQLGFVPKPPIL